MNLGSRSERGMAAFAHACAILLTAVRLCWLLTPALIHRLLCVSGVMIGMLLGLAATQPAAESRHPLPALRIEATRSASRRSTLQRPSRRYPAGHDKPRPLSRRPRLAAVVPRRTRHRQPLATAPPAAA